jgi:glycosyltransferase involved in cell wall biosynthesis
MKPRVSAILPTRDRAPVLRRTIDSVLKQTLPDWELIVVDDGSTDDTEKVVASYADPRIRYVRNTGRAGSAAARNFGIALARAPILAFHDAGDEWPPAKLATQLAAFDLLPERVGVVYSPMTWRYWDGSTKEKTPPVLHHGDGDIWRRALGRGIGGMYLQSSLVRASAFREAGGFDEDFSRWVDLDFFMRVARTRRFQFVPGAAAIYHEMEGGISNNADAMLDSYHRILKKYEADFAGDDELLDPHRRAVARGLAPTRHAAFARGVLLGLIRSGRGRPADFLWLAVTFGGRPLYDALRLARAVWRRVS